jgi:hypothetical protein
MHGPRVFSTGRVSETFHLLFCVSADAISFRLPFALFSTSTARRAPPKGETRR